MGAFSLIMLFALPSAAQFKKHIEIPVSEGATIQLSQPAHSIFIADPTVADIQSPTNTVVFIFGKRAGKTTLFALDESGNKILAQQVTVFQPLDDVKKLIRAELGNDAITLRSSPSGVIMSGLVANAEIADTARNLVVQSLGSGTTLINRVRIAGKMQVSLHVKVIEVARNVNKQLGFNWSALGDLGHVAVVGAQHGKYMNAGGIANAASRATTDLLQIIDSMAANGQVTVLAEPNLTAVSGEAASFLAGGQFPIPVNTGPNGNIAIQYQSYGVGLDFIPTVLSDDLISIKVKPEVSEIASQSITAGSLTVPYTTTRRAETTVELGSGQSFAIGGLMRNTSSKTLAAFPGLAKLPIIGGLFQSGQFQRSETELVIIVTPYIVRPASSTKMLQGPRVQTPAELASASIAANSNGIAAPIAPSRVPNTAPMQLKVIRNTEAACSSKPRMAWQLRDGPSVPTNMPFGTNCPPITRSTFGKPLAEPVIASVAEPLQPTLRGE